MKKLDNKLDTTEIKQTRSKRPTIHFRDSAIDKLIKTNTAFENKKFKAYKFDVPKGSSLKGLQLRFYRNTEIKNFVLSLWLNKRNEYYIIGSYPNIRCKDVEKICLELSETHQDKRGLWLKNPNQTRADEKRLIEKPDTTTTAGKSINGFPVKIIGGTSILHNQARDDIGMKKTDLGSITRIIVNIIIHAISKI